MAGIWEFIGAALLTGLLPQSGQPSEEHGVSWLPTGRAQPEASVEVREMAAPLEPSMRLPAGPKKLTIPSQRTTPAAQLQRLDAMMRRHARAAAQAGEIQQAALAHIEVAQFAIDGIREELSGLRDATPLAAAA